MEGQNVVTSPYFSKEWIKTGDLTNNNNPKWVFLFLLGLVLVSSRSWGADLSGDDLSGQFETASSLLKTFDTILFGWGSPLVGGIFLFWSTWANNKKKIVLFIIALIAAIFILVVPKFVKDLKTLNKGTIFSSIEMTHREPIYV